MNETIGGQIRQICFRQTIHDTIMYLRFIFITYKENVYPIDKNSTN